MHGAATRFAFATGGGAALNKWREWWIPVTLSALLRPGRERAGCAQYALPHLMRQDAASIVFLLEGLKKEVDEEADEADEAKQRRLTKAKLLGRPPGTRRPWTRWPRSRSPA